MLQRQSSAGRRQQGRRWARALPTLDQQRMNSRNPIAYMATACELDGVASARRRSICRVLETLGCDISCSPPTQSSDPRRTEAGLMARLERITESDLVVVDGTAASIELGVELGYAFSLGVPVIAVVEAPAKLAALVSQACVATRIYESELELFKFLQAALNAAKLAHSQHLWSASIVPTPHPWVLQHD